MIGKILDERVKSKVYTSLVDWKEAHPDCPTIVNALIGTNIKSQGRYIKELLPVKGEYTWGDYTEFKFWDSPVEFAREHAQSHPLRRVQESFVTALSEKMAPRFEQGYLIEVLGLRDKGGEDISLAMSDVKCPKSVYHAEMERRAEDARLQQQTCQYLRSLEAAHEATKNSKLIFKIG